MLVPSVFSNHFFDDFDELFDFPRLPKAPGRTHAERMGLGQVMKTDVKETEGGFALAIDLPGFKKDDIRAELKDGYLTVSVEKNTEENEKDEEGRFIRRERYVGRMSRSFYVGKDLQQEDIKAKFEEGVLKLDIPKIDETKKEAEQKLIAID